MKGLYALGSIIPQVHNSTWIAPNSAVIGNVILEENVRLVL